MNATSSTARESHRVAADKAAAGAASESPRRQGVKLSLREQTLKGAGPQGELNIEQIKQILPHRIPFLLIDRILEHEIGKRTVGLKNVTANEACLRRQVAGGPIMPYTLVLESIAQTGGVLLLSLPQNEGKVVFLAGMDNVVFGRAATAGDQLICEAIALKQKGNIGRMEGRAWVEEELVVEAMFLFAVSDS